MTPSRIRAALRAFVTHLGISCVLAALAAWVVMRVWFPYPYGYLAGGLHLFWIMVGVDVVCGPVLTAILFNPRKSRRELTVDLALVALVQLAALAVGLYSMALARPVLTVFESDRLVAVSANQPDPAALPQAPPEMRHLSWAGPRLAGVRAPKNGDETLKSVEMSMRGVEPSARPDWWQSYEKSIPEIQKRMKPLVALRQARPANAQQAIDKAVQETGLSINKLFYLPLVSRKNLDGWIALLDANAKIVGYAPVGGFD